jgi:hypothetical protein
VAEAEAGGEAKAEDESVENFDQTQDLELAKALEEAYLSPLETDDKNDESPCALYVSYQCESDATADKFQLVSSEFREASEQAKEDQYANFYLEVITSAFHRAFTMGRKFRDKRFHRKNLLDKPKSLRDLENHPLRERFWEAQLVHLESHRQMNSWVEADKKHARGQKIIGLMWMFVYKIDKHGFLQRCKARLVICGNQQEKGNLPTFHPRKHGVLNTHGHHCEVRPRDSANRRRKCIRAL